MIGDTTHGKGRIRDKSTGDVACDFYHRYDDDTALEAFARSVDVVTYEFENIAAMELDIIERHVPVRPGRKALKVVP